MTTQTDALAAGLRALTEAVRAAAIDPADQIRLLTQMASYAPSTITSSAPIGSAIAAAQAATAAIARRAALTSLARAVAAYQPQSFDDALAVRKSVTAVLDPEIRIAADGGDTTTFLALRKLRAAIVADLSARGADLPRLTTVTRGQAMPSLALAYQLYQDASRSDDLIARADPPNPAFMPVSFKALSF